MERVAKTSMNIFVDIRHLSQTQLAGVGGYTTQLLRALLEIDSKNEYILFSSGRRAPDLSAVCAPSHPRVHHVHCALPNKLLNLRTFFLRHPSLNWYTSKPIDLLFLPNLNFAVLPTDIPTVLTIHDASWRKYPDFFSRRMRLWHRAVHPAELIKNSAAILTPSQSTKQDLEQLFPVAHKKTHVIAHGVSPVFSSHMQAKDHGIRSRLKLPKRFALYVGTIEPRKNVIAIIEGVKEYRARSGDDLHLVLAGQFGWKSTDARRKLWKRDTKGWVHQIGYASTQDLPALYRSACVFVWPSIYEGFGLPLLEAMACGTPIITSHTSSMPEVVADAAILIDPYNSQDMAQALDAVFGSSSLRASLMAHGLERAKMFTWKKTAQETLNVFHSIEKH